MKSAKLLLLAYRSYKKENLKDISAKLFEAAMSDKTAPRLMEYLHKLTAEAPSKKSKKVKPSPTKKAPPKKKPAKADIDTLSDESSTKLGWDEETESWEEPEKEEQEGEQLEEQSEGLENKALDLLKQAQELEEQGEEEEEEQEGEEQGEEEPELEEEEKKLEITTTQLAQLKAIANKLACKSKKGAKLAHKLLASLKIKKK
jgi:hypothetical protein